MAQFLKPQSRNLDFAEFFTSNLWLLTSILLGYLLVGVTTTILFRPTSSDRSIPLKRLRLVLFRALFMDHNKLPGVHLKLIFLFFNFFLFFSHNFLRCAIKTDKVTVPTHEIVDSTPKLLATSKTLVINGVESDFVKSSPDGSFLKRLSRKKSVKVNNLNDLIRFKTTGVQLYVSFAEEFALAYAMSFTSQFIDDPGSVAFQKSTSYFERLATFPMRRGLDEERKKFISKGWAIMLLLFVQFSILTFFNSSNRRMDASFEHGLQLSFAAKAKEVCMLKLKQNLRVYETLEDFVEDASRKVSPNVKLYNISNLCLFFGGFLVLVSLLFVADVALSKQLKNIKSKLAHGSSIFNSDYPSKAVFRSLQVSNRKKCNKVALTTVESCKVDKTSLEIQ